MGQKPSAVRLSIRCFWEALAAVDDGIWIPCNRLLFERPNLRSHPQRESRYLQSEQKRYAVFSSATGVPQVRIYYNLTQDTLLTRTSRESVTTEYQTMCRAVATLFRKFPDIKRDVARADQDTKPLISKIRKVGNGSVSPVSQHIREYMRSCI